jgi:hypothetical protein
MAVLLVKGMPLARHPGVQATLPFFELETSAKILSQPKSSLNKSICCRAGALACNIQPGRLFYMIFTEVSSSGFKDMLAA